MDIGFKTAILLAFIGYDVVSMIAMGRASSTFNVPAVVALAELYKLILSCVAMHREGKSTADIDFARSHLFAVPGILYAINNNLQFFILRRIPPAIFMVVGNMKAVWTALLFWMLMSRILARKEWLGLLLMFVGVCITQAPNVEGEPYSMVGVGLALVHSLISASASVYNEKLLKSDSGSMHAANVQLYFFGVVLNGVGALTQDATVPLLFGMDKPLTWFVCFNLANIGLFVAAIMKYHDTLTKIGAGAVANILVFVVSVAMGDQSFSVPFVAGAAICLTGVGVYQNEQKR